MRRACITGCGTVSPLGHDLNSFWQGLVEGESGLGEIRGFPTDEMTVTRAGEVKDFQPSRRLRPSEIEGRERIHQFSLYAAREALTDAALRLDEEEPTRCGVILSTSLGAMSVGDEYQRQVGSDGFDVHRLLTFPYYAAATELARALGVRGPVLSPSIACASGTHAVGQAAELIRLGHADILIVGGVESLCPFVVNGFNCLRATTPDVVRPFDARRSGLLLGEGAAVLIVEESEHARRRGARTDIEIAGSGLTGDASHMTAPARDGDGAVRAMQRALDEANLDRHAIDFVSAHGTGTVFNDAMEMVAIATLLGDRVADVPVNSIKAAIGHTLAAAGAFETILCALILRNHVIPPTLNCDELDASCPLDIVRGNARHHAVNVALSTSSGFAGSNAAIVLRRSEPS